MKLIAKKIKSFYANRNGFIQPLFEINNQGELRIVSQSEYPNNGYIFVADYELLDSHIDTQMFIMDSDFFISGDNVFTEKSNESNTSQKRINYNTGISSYFSNVLPHLFIPIYTNKFNIEKQRLIDKSDLINDVFFLKDSNNNYIYGPFERDNYDLKAATYKNYEYESGDKFKEFLDVYYDYDGVVVFKIDLNKIKNHIISDDNGNEFIIDFSKIDFVNADEIIEYTPISILYKWVIDNLHDKGFKLINYIKDVDNIEKLLDTNVDKLRWAKFMDYINLVDSRNADVEQLVNKLNEKGYIESNKNENLSKEIDSLKEMVDIKDDEIIKLKDERVDLENKLKELKDSKNEIIDKEKYPNLSTRLNDLELLGEIERFVVDKQNIDSVNEDIKKLEWRKEYLEESIKKHELEEEKIQASIKLIKQNFDSDVSVHTAKLADAKMYADLLNGITINPQKIKDENEVIKNVQLGTLSQEIASAKLYVTEIQRRLKKLNRDMPFNEVVNLVVTINQSFLTILAGAPGVGKTSLVSKLAQSYGLTNEFGYLEINCSRGWTSSRDLLGFYNPLTGKYQDSKTKLRHALKKSSENINSSYIVLLDEANLSPLEHYWSDFIKLADGDYARQIKIYDKEEISFGDGFRFVATINHDHTTEALSNRLIDRAAIIQLDKPLMVNESVASNDEIYQVMDFNEIQKLFSETLKWKSDEELIKKLLQQIKDRIESNNSGIIISPRKELAIRKYCKVVTGLMEGNAYTALDFAVAQHILPLINGRGEQFEEMLKGLRGDLIDKGMIKSEKLLNKILERGKDLKHFKYIYY